MSPDTLNANLGALRSSMSTLLITHYFVTEEMRSELGRSNLNGTLPTGTERLGTESLIGNILALTYRISAISRLRLLTSSLPKTLCRCFFTVSRLKPLSSAIS